MKSLIILIVLGIISHPVNAQSILKTKPIQVAISHNPVLIYEHLLNHRLSFEVDLKYQHRKWNLNGGEWDFGRFHNSDGYRINLGAKCYFYTLKKKRLAAKNNPIFAPTGNYIGLYATQAFVKTHTLARYNFHRYYLYTEEISESYFGFSLRFGHQFGLGERFVLDCYFGFTQKIKPQIKTIVVETNTPEVLVNTTKKITGSKYGSTIPNGGLSFGYRF